jgi:hypothetical protein
VLLPPFLQNTTWEIQGYGFVIEIQSDGRVILNGQGDQGGVRQRLWSDEIEDMMLEI